MEPMHYGAGKHRPQHHRHSGSPSLSRYHDWELRRDTIPNSLPYRIRTHEVQRPDGTVPKRSSHRHRRASEDLRNPDPMPRPSRRVARSVTVTDRSSRSRRRYEEDDDEDESDHSRTRLKARPRSSFSSVRSSRHSESILPETPPRPGRRRRSIARVRRTSISSSRSSSVDLTPSVSTQDEREKRRPVIKEIEVVSEPEFGPSERRRQQRRREKKAIYVDESDHAGIYEEPLPMRAMGNKTPPRKQQRRRSDSRSSSRKRHNRDRRDEVKHITSAKRPPKPLKRYYGSEPYTEKTLRSRPHATSSSHVASSRSLGSSSRRSSALEAFLAPIRYTPEKPAKIVECIICLDEMPSTKAPKLKCGHRMCHSCLRRSFRISIKDPSRMPPKCCTSDPIPVQLVDDLFSVEFKKNWNRKFAEYSTRNRVYCPKKNCGAWVKPGRIQVRNGRKYAKCNRCDTKICCACNGKWHESRKCPRDEETRQILQQAKENGWQRCFSCRTMIELKEGCNHMTCHCGSEFCMICGAKWKSCECPWFNYDTIEQEPLGHMQMPSPALDRERRSSGDGLSPRDFRTGRGPVPGARSRQATYEEEMYHRRLQEQEDEDYARRLQYDGPDDDDYISDYDDDGGLGIAAGRFMNDDYRRGSQNHVQPPPPPPPAPPMPTFERTNSVTDYVSGVNRARGVRGTSIDRLADRFSEQRQGGSPIHRSFGNPIAHGAGPAMAMGPPPPAPVPLLMRHHTMDDEIFNSPRGIRVSERMIPRRATHDYMDEVDIYAPQSRRRYREPEVPKDSVLAGLTGPGQGLNRVFEWRQHVEPGLPDNHTAIAT